MGGNADADDKVNSDDDGGGHSDDDAEAIWLKTKGDGRCIRTTMAK
jgi:hypothetical protein